MRKKPEILAPVGNEVMLKAAVDAGADAVYFGIKELNMRITANNFELSQIRKVVKQCHENKVKAYLTLNTIVYDDELDKLKKIISDAKKSKVDAIICWDMSVLKEALRQKVPVHLSTQASVSNFEAVKYYSEIGVKRIVLARECTLKQIKSIINKIEKEKVNVEIEAFVHGALCVSISGRCFVSEFQYKKSANRGDCIQPCRREYDILDKETGDKLKIGNNYVMSPKDLCTITFIDRLIEAGINSFKIEGRAKNLEYVKTVVRAYKNAVDVYFEGKFTKQFAKELEEKLKKVYHRGFSKGFYMGVPINEFTDSYGGKQKTKKDYVGYVKNYYKRLKVAEIKVESVLFRAGDTLMIQGPTTGVIEAKAKSMQINYKDVDIAEKGKPIAVKFDKQVRPNDKVFLLKEI